MTNKTKSYNIFPHPSRLPKFNLTPSFLYLLPASGAAGQGTQVAVSTSHFAGPASSVGDLLTLCICSSMGSSHRSTGPARACALWAFHRCYNLAQPPSAVGEGLQGSAGGSLHLHGPTWGQLSHCVGIMGCGGISDPVPGARPPSPPLTMAPARLFLSQVHSLSSAAVAQQPFFHS